MAAKPVRLKAPLLGVVCAKCVKRAGGNGRKAGKILTRALRDRTGRKVLARDVACLKLCPRHRVLIASMHGQCYVVDAENWAGDAAALLVPGPPP